MHNNIALALVYANWLPKKLLNENIEDYNNIIEDNSGVYFSGEIIFECEAPIWIRHLYIKKNLPSKNIFKNNDFKNITKIIKQGKCTCINIGFNLYYEYKNDLLKTIALILKNFSKKIDKDLFFWCLCDTSSFVKRYHIKTGIVSIVIGPELLLGEKIQWDYWIWEPKEICNYLTQSSKEQLKYPIISEVYDKENDIPTLKHIFLDIKQCPNCRIEASMDASFCLKCGYFFRNDINLKQKTFIINFDWKLIDEL